MMFQRISRLGVAALLTGLFALSAVGQDAEDSAKKSRSSKAQATAKKNEPKSTTLSTPRIRLPRFFGKLNLTESQRQKVLDVQTRYSEKIKALQEQLDELRSQRRKDASKVLTKKQKGKWNELVAAARAKRTQVSLKKPKQQPKPDES